MNCSVCHLCKLSIAYRHTSPSNQTLCNRCRTTRTSWWWTRGWWRRAKSSRWRYCSTTVLSSPWVINRNCKFSPWCIWDKKRPRRDEKSQNGKSRPEKFPTFVEGRKNSRFDNNLTKSLWVSPDALSLRPRGFNNSKFIFNNCNYFFTIKWI